MWTPRWLLVHAAAVALSIGFLLLGWWQVQRAAGGNMLSFGYAIEWPVFAGFVIFVWIKEMRRVLRPPVVDTDNGDARQAPGDQGSTPGHDSQLDDHGSTPGVGWRLGDYASSARPTADDPAVVASAARADTASRTRRTLRRARSGPAYDDSDDEELAAYNRYLAWLNANPHASPSEYPG